MRQSPAWIGVGSNLDDPLSQVREAIGEIAAIDGCRLTQQSSYYRSAPLGPQDQPDFINAVVAVVTVLDARALLHELQRIESRHGRRRHDERWGPRTLDLDLLVFAEIECDSPDLRIPHPGIGERNFVLLPLHEIAPELTVPGRGPLAELLAKNDNSLPAIEKLRIEAG